MFEDNSQTPGLVPVLPATGLVEARDPGFANPERQATMSELVPYFLGYGKVERNWSDTTLRTYGNSLRWIIRIIGDLPPQRIRLEHVLRVKADCVRRGAGNHHTATVVAALKSFLRFCQLSVGLETMDVQQIRCPRIPKTEVLYLTPEEVQQFVAAIPIHKSQRGFDLKWLCFRTLVEVLLGTGVRISEGLSLKRTSVNFQTGEATIVGKGNKERVIFFSPRSLNWIKEYLMRRKDQGESLFVVGTNGRPLTLSTALVWFRRFREMAGIKKKVTAHVFRHTVATTLLFNGCPIGHIKDILGHERLITTCNFYLGTDKRAAKKAHGKYLDYDITEQEFNPAAAGYGFEQRG